MGWFDEQIKQRKKHDEEIFSESFSNLADALTGKSYNLNDDREIAKGAIADVLKYFGCKSVELPNDVKEFNDAIEYSFRPYGIMRRGVKLTDEWYKDAFGPFILFLKDSGDPIALIPDHIYGYKFRNPNTGKFVRANKNNVDLFESDGICFYKPFPLRKLSSIDLVKYALFTRSTSDIVLTLTFMGISTLIGLLLPKISYFLYSDVIESKSISLLASTIIFYICINVSNTLFQTFRSMVDSKINTKMSVQVQAATMMRILSLPPSFFRKYSSGELSSRQGYVSSLAATLINTIFNTGFSSLFSLAYISSIFEYAPSLVVPSLIIVVITVVFSLVSTLIQTKITKETMELSSKESGLSFSIITGIQKIKLAGAERRVFAKWAKLFTKQAKDAYNPPFFIKMNAVISMFISYCGTLVMYFVAIKSNVSVAEFNAFNTAYGMVSGTFMSMASIALTFAQIKPTLEMASPILEAEPEISEGKKVLTTIRGGIEMNNVSFKYTDNMPLVVNDMSFKISPGQYIAIVGKTGCGKSTLIRLLLGFDAPQRGSIYYDGIDIKDIDLKSLRRKIGVVMQNGSLFQGDIFSNITISAPWLTMDDAWWAAEVAGIADDIRKMPMGMFTVLSEGSGGISGGQKQRLMIARAIAPKPRILIFDEATSALDNLTQKQVSEALDKLKCTRIVIAHRLSTIKHCDRIMYLEDGKILEDGTYDELIKLNGKFAELVERQRLDND